MYAVMKNGAMEREAVGNIVWSPTHYQTAESLSDEERKRFNLYLILNDQPALGLHQKWGAPVFTISGTDVLRTWVPVEKTPAELAEDARRAVALKLAATLSRAAFIIALRRVLGITEGHVFALISQMPAGEEQETARDLWENAREFRRSNPFLLALAKINGSTEEQIDEVFRTGSALNLD